MIKIDINHIIRGSVFPCRNLDLCSQAQIDFEFFCDANVLSLEDLYAGKICAALDRQHPRDFFDTKILLENEGVSQDLMEAFIVYLISHNRPIHELLMPNFHSFEKVFESEFLGMAFEEIAYADLLDSAHLLVREINQKLTDKHREFLMSFKDLKPKWELLDENHIPNLPAVKWKLLNLKQLSDEKRQKQLALLQKVLYP